MTFMRGLGLVFGVLLILLGGGCAIAFAPGIIGGGDNTGLLMVLGLSSVAIVPGILLVWACWPKS